jgi:hypothetical protein
MSSVVGIVAIVAIMLAVAQAVIAIHSFATADVLSGVVDGLDAVVLLLLGVVFLRRRLHLTHR